MPDQFVEWRRIVKRLCPNCHPGHVLDNGRLWGLCSLQRLLPHCDNEEETEAELIAVVKALPKRRKRRESTHA